MWLSWVVSVRGSMRSQHTTPRRWSISCCRMRAYQPDATLTTGSPRPPRGPPRLHAVAAYDAAQVVDLVLQDARVPAGRDLDDRLAALVEGLDAHAAPARDD